MGRYERHAALVDHMAEAQGLDLDEAAQRGHLSSEARDMAVLRCTGCAQPEACAQWLADPQTRTGPRPEYCRNGQTFDDLLHKVLDA
ncbi:MAG: DUF6455 family protein [Paracoccaceae bacterium]